MFVVMNSLNLKLTIVRQHCPLVGLIIKRKRLVGFMVKMIDRLFTWPRKVKWVCTPKNTQAKSYRGRIMDIAEIRVCLRSGVL